MRQQSPDVNTNKNIQTRRGLCEPTASFVCTTTEMPSGLKRKASPPELDLDALFVGLDAQVGTSISQRLVTKKPTIPSAKAVRSEDTRRHQTPAQKLREKDISEHLDGLLDTAVFSSQTTRVPTPKPVTPRKLRSVGILMIHV